METLNEIFNITNNVLDYIFLWSGLIFIFGYPFYFLIKEFKKENKSDKNQGKHFLTQIFPLIILSIIAGLFWGLPEIMMWQFNLDWLPVTSIRWMEISLAFMFFLFSQD